jgi:hypothetical protein
MKPGDLLKVKSLATAWRYKRSFHQFGTLKVGEPLIFFSNDTRLFMTVLSRFGMCCVAKECVRLHTDETR